MAISNGFLTYSPTNITKQPDWIDYFLTKGIASPYIDIKNVSDIFLNELPPSTKTEELSSYK